MKLALCLSLSCYIAASLQQQKERYIPYRDRVDSLLSSYNSGQFNSAFNNFPYHSNLFYPPLYYEQPKEVQNYSRARESKNNKAIELLLMRLRLSQHLKQLKTEHELTIAKNGQGQIIPEEGNQAIMARVKNRLWPIRNKPIEVPTNETEKRSFFLQNLFLRNQVLTTSTKYSVTTSTVTVSLVSYCIKSSSFYGGSSQACRKRRDSEQPGFLLADESLFSPTPVENIEVTSRVESLIAAPSLPEVDSSLLPQPKTINGYSPGLFGRVTTSTVTSFAVITSVSFRTVSLGSNLSCLPDGFYVC